MSLSPILTSAAFAPIQNIGWIRVTGSDRVRWLNGMVTNNIAALKPGEGCYNFFLNAQGRILGDATAWMMEDSILLETAADRIPQLMAMLDHFIIMDDVELAPLEHRAGLLVIGPDASKLLAAIDLSTEPVDPMELVNVTWHSASIQLVQAHSPLVPRFEVWSDAAAIGLLAESLKSAGGIEVTPENLEQLRILSGTPLYGTDIRNTDAAKDLPQETAQTRALHFSKGCYLGQEIVERIRSRGNVHRTFSGFILTGELPAPGTPLSEMVSSLAEGGEPASMSSPRPVGELTSVTRIELPTGSMQIALGYIRRETLDRGAVITYPGGTATASTLPFSLPESRV